MTDLQMATIYGIRYADQRQYFYVGSTKGPIEARLKYHIRHSKSKRMQHKLLQGRVTIESLAEVPANERYNIEMAYIRQAKRSGHPLINVVTTAWNRSDYDKAATTKAYWDSLSPEERFERARKSNASPTRSKASDSRKAALSQTMRGRKLGPASDEHKKNNSEAQKKAWSKKTEEERAEKARQLHEGKRRRNGQH